MNASAPDPPALAPVSSSGLLDSWLGGWTATIDGLAACYQAALTRTPQPSSFPRLLDVLTNRRAPTWSTPHEVLFESPVARLRDFSTSHRRSLVPTLVLPPQAGHDSCIVDYSAEQSQMRTILESGLQRALALDWIGATPETADASIEDYIDVIDRAIEHCGGRVNLIGDCQGGWLATIYAALYPERINTLTLAGAPIDFHAGEPVIHELMRHLAPGGDLRFYENLVASGGGVLKGEHLLNGFIMIEPGDEIARQLELLRHLEDPAHVARYREFEDWFKHTQDIPGGFYLWILRHLFRDNALIAGTLTVRGEQVDLTRINMPLNLLAGETDHITPSAQVFALAALASTPGGLIKRRVTTGGHLGLFMGHEALREHWPPMLADVLGASKATPKRAARRAVTSAPSSPGPSSTLRP